MTLFLLAVRDSQDSVFAPLVPFVTVLVFVVVALGVVGALFRAIFGTGKGGAEDLAYQRKPSVLTEAERSFYGVLLSVSEREWVIAFKVRLADVVMPKPAARGKWQALFNRICAKHVDFLVCRADDLAPLLVIELDDASHGEKRRVERDGFLDTALKSAGVPILRVKAQRAYRPEEVRRGVTEAMGRT